MATKSFLTAQETNTILELLDLNTWDGVEGTALCSSAFEASKACGDFLYDKLSAHPNWRLIRPIRLGSWAREELCARSDIDLLFLGPEEKVAEFVRFFNDQGIKIRGRVPEDPHDWTVGVQAFDVMAVLTAVPFFSDDKKVVDEQAERIKNRGAKYLKGLFKTLALERRDREKRYDSLANFLEPNLKYGHGALRDLEQANMIRSLFPQKFIGLEDVFTRLHRLKGYLMCLRHFLHLKGGGDILSSQLQFEIAQKRGDSSPISFMGQVEEILSEVSFWADWVEEVAKSNIDAHENRKKTQRFELSEALKMLSEDPSVIQQEIIRSAKIEWPEKKTTARIMDKYFHYDMPEDVLIALFRSRLLEKMVPDLGTVKGLVQHDQYHRYSCDAHTLQAVREVLRLRKSPGRYLSLKSIVKELSDEDWNILFWTALFHDLGKGKDGDHATVGEKMAIRYLTSTGHRLRQTIEVAWMVKNHLIMSSAAFRMNPKSPSTWGELFKRGVRGRRIARLAVLTALDIRATNPEALNDWKIKLLSELVHEMQSPTAGDLDQLILMTEKAKVPLDRSLIEGLDPRLVQVIRPQTLTKDLQRYVSAKSNLEPMVWKQKGDELWIRFHAKTDRPGLFVDYCERLMAAGLSVSEAFISTHAQHGVYDWFKVKTKKNPKVILPILSKAKANTTSSDQNLSTLVRFSVIDVVSKGDKEAILSFRGKDQRGALLAAGRGLYGSGFEILGAKVHTWGRQIDDVFTVKMPENFEKSLEHLRSTLLE